MRTRTDTKPLALLLCACLLLGLLSGCGETKQAQSQSAGDTLDDAESVQPMDASAPSAPAQNREETVYVKATPDGTVESITSEVSLKETGEAELVRDVSTLRDIRNTVGDEEYLLLEDGTLLWENHGEDIHYKGTASGELPVSVRITCWLDGEEIAPAELAGRSGDVRIRFDYDNRTRQTVSTQDGEVSVCTPFAALTMAMLPEEHFTDVEVKNGRVMELDGESAVIGLALPGLSQCLSLSEFEPTEELELPEYVELSAHATEFTLDFTATVLTPGLLDELETEDLDKLDELREDMEKLQDATDELTKGVGELAEGAGEFGGYLKEYTGGVAQVSDGAQALAQGLKTLDDELSALSGKMEEISKSLDCLSKADWKEIANALGLEQLTLPDGTKIKLSEVQAAAEALAGEESRLKDSLEALKAGAGQWEAYAAEAQKYAENVAQAVQAIPSDLTGQVNRTAREQVSAALQERGLTEEEISAVVSGIDLSQLTDPVDDARRALEALPAPELPDALPDGESVRSLIEGMQERMSLLHGAAQALKQQAGKLSQAETAGAAVRALTGTDFEALNPAQGTKQLIEGVDRLCSGAKALSDGVSALKTAGSALNKGYSALSEGVDALKEGVEKYNEEGISELTGLTGESYRNLLRQIRGLKETDDSYHSFSGLAEGTKGSVRFIIETDKIG